MAATKPVATVVLPCPLAGAATTTRGAPPGAGTTIVIAPSPFDASLSLAPDVHRVLDLRHLGDQVGGVNQVRVRGPPGDHHVLATRPIAQRGHHLCHVHPPPLHRVGELVEHVQVMLLRGQSALDLRPALGGVRGMVLLGARTTRPGPPGAHLVPLHRPALTGLLMHPAQRGQRPLLADLPPGALHELENTDGPARVPGPQGQAERGGGLPLVLPGVHDQQWLLAALTGRQTISGDGNRGPLGHVRPPHDDRRAARPPGPAAHPRPTHPAAPRSRRVRHRSPRPGPGAPARSRSPPPPPPPHRQPAPLRPDAPRTGGRVRRWRGHRRAAPAGAPATDPADAPPPAPDVPSAARRPTGSARPRAASAAVPRRPPPR